MAPGEFHGVRRVLCVCVGLTVVHSGHPWLGLLRSPWLKGLALLSYPLYLTHLPVMHYTPVLLARAGITSGALQSVATWIGVFAAAVVLHRFVERPALAMKARWPYAPGPREPRGVGATTVVAAAPIPLSRTIISPSSLQKAGFDLRGDY